MAASCHGKDHEKCRRIIMLTFRQLDDLPDTAIKIVAQTEQAIIDDMARRIAIAGKATDTANWQASRLEAIGTAQEKLLTELGKATKKTEAELIRLFDEAATRALNADDKLYKAAGYNPVPLAENTYMQQLIQAGLMKTSGAYTNLTNTTAGNAMQQYRDALDLAYHKIASGGFSYQQAIRSAIRRLTRNGLASVLYPTGHIDYLDVAVRRAVMTGISQTTAQLQLARMDEMGTDLVETTAHPGARPSHATWQGEWFSRSGKSDKYPDFYSGTGYGTGEGLCGWNCRHSFFPVFEGLSDQAYNADKLREYNNRSVEYKGKTMSLYDATQQQRYIERQIRRWKRETSALISAGLDSTAAAQRGLQWQARQRDFIKQTGLRRDYFRERAGKQLIS